VMHRILDINAQAEAAYLNAQIEAAAQAGMILDTWGGALADGAYQRFSLDNVRRELAQHKREPDGARVPAIAFTKGGGRWL
ncbi:uroporphyrinogen decarboxylase family protein, partial [Burkholderia pseudomallei]